MVCMTHRHHPTAHVVLERLAEALTPTPPHARTPRVWRSVPVATVTQSRIADAVLSNQPHQTSKFVHFALNPDLFQYFLMRFAAAVIKRGQIEKGRGRCWCCVRLVTSAVVTTAAFDVATAVPGYASEC